MFKTIQLYWGESWLRWCWEDLVSEEVSPLALNLLVGDGQPDAFGRTYLGKRILTETGKVFPAIIATIVTVVDIIKHSAP